MDDNEAVDGTLGITDALRELWDRAVNPNLTTSQKIEPVSKEAAEKYRLQKEVNEAVKKIKADAEKILALEEERRAREQKNDPWKFARNVAKFIVGEIDKSEKR
jgi:DNA-binding transcriptional regulator GbsR (MarR family)